MKLSRMYINERGRLCVVTRSNELVQIIGVNEIAWLVYELKAGGAS